MPSRQRSVSPQRPVTTTAAGGDRGGARSALGGGGYASTAPAEKKAGTAHRELPTLKPPTHPTSNSAVMGQAMNAEEIIEARGASSAIGSQLTFKIQALRASLSTPMRQTASERKPSSASPVDAEARSHGVDLDILRDLKAVFDSAIEDSEGGPRRGPKLQGISEEEFLRVFGAKLCPGMTPEETKVWFRGIDSDCSGRISWAEISHYIVHSYDSFVVQRAVKQRIFEDRPVEAIKASNYRAHSRPITHMKYFPEMESLFTASTDGLVRQWTPNLRLYNNPLHSGKEWITGMMTIPTTSRVLVMQSNYLFFLYGLQLSRKDKKEEEEKKAHGEDDKGSDIPTAATERMKRTELLRVYGAPSPAVRALPGGGGIYDSTMNRSRAAGGSINATAVPSMPAVILRPYTQANALCSEHFASLGGGTETVVVGAEDGTVALYNLHQSDKPFGALSGSAMHTDWVTWIRTAPDIDNIMTGSADGSIKITNVEKNTTVSILKPSRVKSIYRDRPVFHFDCETVTNSRMLSHGSGRSCWIWNAVTGAKIAELRDSDRQIQYTALAPERNLLFGLTDNKVLKVWDMRTWSLMDNMNDVNPYEEEAGALYWSPRHSSLFVGSRDVLEWKVLAGRTGASVGAKTDDSTSPSATLPPVKEPPKESGGRDRGGGGGRPPLPTSPVAGRGQRTPTPVGGGGQRPRGATPSSAHSQVGDHLPGSKGTQRPLGTVTGIVGAGAADDGVTEPILSLHYAPNSRYVVAIDRFRVVLWSTSTLTCIWSWLWHVPLGPKQTVTCTALGVDERKLLVGSDQGDVMWINVSSGAYIRTLNWNRHMLYSSPEEELGEEAQQQQQQQSQYATAMRMSRLRRLRFLSASQNKLEITAVAHFPFSGSSKVGIAIAAVSNKLLSWHDPDPLVEQSAEREDLMEAPECVVTLKDDFGQVVMMTLLPHDIGIGLLATAKGFHVLINVVTLIPLSAIEPPPMGPGKVQRRSVDVNFLMAPDSQAPTAPTPFSQPDPRSNYLTMEALIPLQQGLFLSAMSDSSLRLYAFDKDALVTPMATFHGASSMNEVVTCGTTVQHKGLVAVGDTAGCITVFKCPKLLNQRELRTRILPMLHSGQLNETKIVEGYIDFLHCFCAHRASITDMQFVEGESRVVVTVGMDSKVRAWDVSTRALLCDLGHDLLSLPMDDPSFLSPPLHPFCTEGEVVSCGSPGRIHDAITPPPSALLPPLSAGAFTFPVDTSTTIGARRGRSASVHSISSEGRRSPRTPRTVGTPEEREINLSIASRQTVSPRLAFGGGAGPTGDKQQPAQGSSLEEQQRYFERVARRLQPNSVESGELVNCLASMERASHAPQRKLRELARMRDARTKEDDSSVRRFGALDLIPLPLLTAAATHAENAGKKGKKTRRKQ